MAIEKVLIRNASACKAEHSKYGNCYVYAMRAPVLSFNTATVVVFHRNELHGKTGSPDKLLMYMRFLEGDVKKN